MEEVAPYLEVQVGGQGGNRTPDASLFRAALYQLSYLAGSLYILATGGKDGSTYRTLLRTGPPGAIPSFPAGKPRPKVQPAGSATPRLAAGTTGLSKASPPTDPSSPTSTQLFYCCPSHVHHEPCAPQERKCTAGACRSSRPQQLV